MPKKKPTPKKSVAAKVKATKPKKTAKPAVKKVVAQKPVAKNKPVEVVKAAPVEAKKPEVKKPVTVDFNSPLVKKYQEHKGDTGSTAVQVALNSDRINELVKHLKKHAKDFDSKRGLLILVGKRRRLLNYLKKTNQKTYETMIGDLKLRK